MNGSTSHGKTKKFNHEGRERHEEHFFAFVNFVAFVVSNNAEAY